MKWNSMSLVFPCANNPRPQQYLDIRKHGRFLFSFSLMATQTYTLIPKKNWLGWSCEYEGVLSVEGVGLHVGLVLIVFPRVDSFPFPHVQCPLFRFCCSHSSLFCGGPRITSSRPNMQLIISLRPWDPFSPLTGKLTRNIPDNNNNNDKSNRT